MRSTIAASILIQSSGLMLGTDTADYMDMSPMVLADSPIAMPEKTFEPTRYGTRSTLSANSDLAL